MKVFGLIGKMIILISVFSICSGQGPMTVWCSTDWFMVTVHPYLLKTDVYVHFHELLLGLGCPPNHVQPHMYKFTYRITECGIRAKAISHNMIMYSTEIHYTSKATSSRRVIPVSCTAPQDSVWLTPPYSGEVVSQTGTTTHNGETCYKVSTLSQSSQSPNCDCPPYMFNREPHTQARHHEAEA